MSPSYGGMPEYKEEGMVIPDKMLSSGSSSLALGTAVGLYLREDLRGEPEQTSCSSTRTAIRHVELPTVRSSASRSVWSINRQCHH